MIKKFGKFLLCITLVLLVAINVNILLAKNKNFVSINKKYITTEPKNTDIYINTQNAKKSLSIGVVSIFTICSIGIGSFVLKKK